MLIAVLGLSFWWWHADSAVACFHRVPAPPHCSQPTAGLAGQIPHDGGAAVSLLAMLPVLTDTAIAAANVDS